MKLVSSQSWNILYRNTDSASGTVFISLVVQDRALKDQGSLVGEII